MEEISPRLWHWTARHEQIGIDVSSYYLEAEGVVLDLCPTANWRCKAVPSLAEHPLPMLVREGVRCTISTDSRTVAETTLTREFELAAEMGLSEEELRDCNETAYEAKFG